MKQCIASAAALLCASCALGVPTGVRVRTAPTIRVPVSSGSGTVELERYLEETIQRNILDDYPAAKIYRYGKENTLHILVRYPLMDVRIPSEEDLEEYGNLKNYLKATGVIEENDTEIRYTSKELKELIDEKLIKEITNIKLAEFVQALPGNLGFKSVVAKIYAGPEDTRYGLYGNISADYWKKYDKNTYQILGGKDSPGYMVFKGNLPSFKKRVLSAEKRDRYAQLTPSLGDIELKDIFNEFPERLDFYFDVVPQIGENLGEITFTVEEIEEMKSLQLIADMVLDISLAFVVANPAESAVMRLTDVVGDFATSRQDIFGRKTPEENSSLFDGVQDVTLRLNYDNSLLSSDLTAKIWVRPADSDQKHALTVRDFTVKPGRNRVSEIALDAGYVRKHLLKPKDMELEFVPDKDGTLFSFGPGADDPKSPQYGVGGSFTLTGVEVETVLDHTFFF